MGKLPIWLMAGFLAAGCMVAEAGKMYRWTDANGNPVVSDRPPPAGIPFTEIGKQYSPDRRREALRQTPEAPADAATPSESGWIKDPERCAETRERLAKLESATRVMMDDGQGGTRVLSEEERAAEIAKARRTAERYCEN